MYDMYAETKPKTPSKTSSKTPTKSALKKSKIKKGKNSKDEI